jgi:hypothetical protein
MTQTSQKMSVQLEGARLTIVGARYHPEIKKRLARFGYQDKQYEEALGRLNNIKKYTARQDENYGLLKEATVRCQQERAQLKDLYQKHLSLARLGLKDHISAGDVLKLWGMRQRDLAGWMEQVSAFYDHADRYAETLTTYAISPEDIARGKAMVQAIEESRVRQARGRSEAQIATKLRRQAFDELMQWLGEFRTIARVACKDEPQYLEALGEVVR